MPDVVGQLFNKLYTVPNFLVFHLFRCLAVHSKNKPVRLISASQFTPQFILLLNIFFFWLRELSYWDNDTNVRAVTAFCLLLPKMSSQNGKWNNPSWKTFPHKKRKKGTCWKKCEPLNRSPFVQRTLSQRKMPSGKIT